MMIMILERFKREKEEINLDEYVSRKEFNRLKRLVDAQKYYLDTVHAFYTLEPSPLLAGIVNLHCELLRFFHNVCRKHDLDYWIDRDTLLGLVRQAEFMPFDGLSIGMDEHDLKRLKEVFKSEVADNDFGDIRCTYGQSQNPFEIIFECDDIMAVIRVYVHDFIDDKKDVIYPLERMPLGNYTFSIPNDFNEYLNLIYDDGMMARPGVPDTAQLTKLKKGQDSLDRLKECISIVKRLNDEFRGVL